MFAPPPPTLPRIRAHFTSAAPTTTRAQRAGIQQPLHQESRSKSDLFVRSLLCDQSFDISHFTIDSTPLAFLLKCQKFRIQFSASQTSQTPNFVAAFSQQHLLRRRSLVARNKVSIAYFLTGERKRCSLQKWLLLVVTSLSACASAYPGTLAAKLQTNLALQTHERKLFPWDIVLYKFICSQHNCRIQVLKPIVTVLPLETVPALM